MRPWAEDGATPEERELLAALKPGAVPPAGAEASVLAALSGRLGLELGGPHQSEPSPQDLGGGEHGVSAAPHTSPDAAASAGAPSAAALPEPSGSALTGASAPSAAAPGATVATGAAAAKVAGVGGGVWSAALWKWLGVGVMLGGATSGALRAGDQWLNSSPGDAGGAPSASVEFAPQQKHAAGGTRGAAPLETPTRGLAPTPGDTQLGTPPPARSAVNAAPLAGGVEAAPPEPVPQGIAAEPNVSGQPAPRAVAGYAEPSKGWAEGAGGSQLKEERERLALARAALQAGQAAQALSLLGDLQRRRPVLMLSQEHEALSIFALAQAGSRAQAQARARAFIARYPTSPLVERVAPHAK